MTDAECVLLAMLGVISSTGPDTRGCGRSW
jgi:hypothetical protein